MSVFYRLLFWLLQDQFTDYMFQQAVKMEFKILLENKSRFVLVHSSSGFKHALKGKLLFLLCFQAWSWTGCESG